MKKIPVVLSPCSTYAIKSQSYTSTSQLIEKQDPQSNLLGLWKEEVLSLFLASLLLTPATTIFFYSSMNQAFLKDMALDVQYRRVKSSKGSRLIEMFLLFIVCYQVIRLYKKIQMLVFKILFHDILSHCNNSNEINSLFYGCKKALVNYFEMNFFFGQKTF